MRKTTGISLMLLIFLSLCLITFSLLSLSGARADERLSRKSADRTTEYYAAVTEGNRLLALIDEQLALCLTEAETEDDPQAAFLENAAQITGQIPGADWNSCSSSNRSSDPDTDSVLLSFTVPVTDGQVLLAELVIRYPENSPDTMYEITAWQVVNTDEWNPDTSQNLYRLTEAG